MDLKHITLQVCEIAKNTGIYLATERKNFNKENVIQKHSHDYVSYVDREAEKVLVKELNALLPEAGFITEEGTVEQAENGLNWIIDPLDGTTNFIQDYAPYCVSIALRKDEEILIGVVYEVCRDECFYAWRGGNAYMNGDPIHTSKNSIEKAFIGMDLPYNAEEYKPVILNVMNKLYGKVSSIRINGSAAISLCYVAIGRYDGWGEAFINTWDYSAGVLIVREAGGRITDFKGKDDISGTHHIIATNGIIHEELKNVLDIDII
ncbi:MAG: inositol monophosphatase family protein [Dysgonomonas sp.]|nr:inositol monophosphatase family protein [Dysgonomonas sp.]